MFNALRSTSLVERDARAEHEFTRALIAELARDAERAERERAMALDQLAALERERATANDVFRANTPIALASSNEKRGEKDEREPDGERSSASGTPTATDVNHARFVPAVDFESQRPSLNNASNARANEFAGEDDELGVVASVGALKSAADDFASERATLLEALEDMRAQFRSATASAHKANAEVNALAHQNRAKLEKERRRGDAAEAKLMALERAAASELAGGRDELERLRREISSLRATNEELEVRVGEMMRRAMEIEEDARRERERATEAEERAAVGVGYADEAAVSLRRTAVNAQTTAKALHARLYPDGDPELEKGRILIIAKATLVGHPMEDAERDVTRAIRARLATHSGKRLVILVSENLSDLLPDDVVSGVRSRDGVTRRAEAKSATLRIAYAFDVVDADTGARVRSEEKAITIPIGAASTAHAFAMQSVWIEAVPTSVEDALKSSFSRLRDAEAAASSAKTRAIALTHDVIELRHRNGSALRALDLDARESALDVRSEQLDAEAAGARTALALAKAESERVTRDAERIVANARANLRVAEDEILRLHALERARVHRSAPQRADRRADVDVDAATPTSAERAKSIARSRSAADAIALAEARLKRITTTCAMRSNGR